MKIPRTLRILLAIVVTLVAGCQGGGGAPEFPPGAKVLRLAEINDVPTLDPAAGYDTVSWEFEQMLFSTLVRYGEADVKLHPEAALAWAVSPDATVFTFHLRHDVRFTSGRAVTSADFRYAIERVLNPRTSSKGMEYFRAIVGAPAFIAGRAAHVSGIETPDPWTIIFHLAAPDPIFVDKLAMPFASAVPREAVARWGEDFSRHPVGSGPFMLKQWIGGQRIVIVRNPDYFIRGLPKLDAVVDLLGVSAELEWLKFEAGEIDVSAIPTAEFAYVMKTPSLKRLTTHRVTVATQYLGMNCQMAPFTDVRVRQAFNYAINKRKLIAILNGRGVVAHGVMPPALPGYDPGLTGYAYDPERARQLLAAAGVSHGLAPELWLLADQTELMVGQSLQQDLALVGVNLTLKPIALAPLLEAVRQPNTVPFMAFGWEADFPDPSNFLSVLFSRSQWGANNDTFYYNPRVDALLREAAPVTDLQKRYALYQQAEKIIVADAPWVFLYHPVAYVIHQPWVHDFVLNPMRPTRLEKVWLSPHR
ncbi:MAG TPA: ABC transporter substrate-binding protein [Candidatus Binataceae bacterium]|nr:ABC transporter substrate-binding protein [Candidatus Binataceae bacterium]